MEMKFSFIKLLILLTKPGSLANIEFWRIRFFKNGMLITELSENHTQKPQTQPKLNRLTIRASQTKPRYARVKVEKPVWF
jgi:hypothetical protein